MKFTLMLLALLATGVASAQTREKQAERLGEFMPYVGEPVDRFQFWELVRYELVGEYKVVVWPRLKEAYLITVDGPCNDLEWEHSIALTSSVNVVHTRFDHVLAGRSRCRINEIRPIDYARYLKDRKDAREAGKDQGGHSQGG
jgi:hypothetical protein